jgi:hypothetical protein
MNREFSQRILAIPVADAPGTIAPPFTGFDEFHSDISIDPSYEPKTSNGNLYYAFELRIAQSNLDDTLKHRYRNRRPSILILFDTDGNWYQVGSTDYAVRATIAPVKLSNEIKFSASLINSPF